MQEATKNWPDLAAALYDKLTGRNAEITYKFDQLQVLVPSHAGASAEHAPWSVSGTLRISTSDSGK